MGPFWVRFAIQEAFNILTLFEGKIPVSIQPEVQAALTALEALLLKL